MSTLLKSGPLGASPVGVKRNLWRTQQGRVSRMNFPIDGLALYLPLWHPELSGSPIISKDLNAHSGTVYGATWTSLGRVFDGNDYIIVPDSSVFQGTGSFTVEGWVKWSAFTQEFGGVIFSNQGSRWGFQTRTTGTFAFYVNDSLSAKECITSALAENTWYHFASVYDSVAAVIRLYLDNVQIGTDVAIGTRLENTGGVIIGDNGNAPGAGHFFLGTQGEIRYYNRVLSLAEFLHNGLTTKWRYQ